MEELVLITIGIKKRSKNAPLVNKALVNHTDLIEACLGFNVEKHYPELEARGCIGTEEINSFDQDLSDIQGISMFFDVMER